MSPGIPRALLSLFVILPALILSATPAAAEVSLDAEIGFHGLFRLGKPFPLSVVLTNTGTTADGTLEVEVWKGGPSKVMAAYPFYHRRKVFLEAGGRRRVQFTVQPDSMARPLRVTFRAPGVKVSRDLDLRGHFFPSPVILLVTGSGAVLSVPLAGGLQTPLVTLAAGELPSDSRAYLGVWAVLLYEPSLRDLSAHQRDALNNWLVSGGRVLILGGLHYALYQEASLETLLPVRVTGLRELTAVPNLERRYGYGLNAPGKFWIQDARLTRGTVLIQEAGAPILVEALHGRGKVLYLSLDVGRPPISRWQGLGPLFSDLLGESREVRPGPWPSWNDYVFSFVLSESHLFSSDVTHVPFLSFLFFYIGGLGFLAWFWHTGRVSREALGVAFLSLVGVAAVGGYLYFDQSSHRSDGLLISSNQLDVGPDGYAGVQSNVGIFATRRREVHLHMLRDWSDLEMIRPRVAKEEAPVVVLEEGARSSLLSFPSREWNFRLFRARSMASFALQVRAAREGDRLSLDLFNGSRKKLTECWMLFSGKAYPLGDLSPGSRLERTVTVGTLGEVEEGSGKRVPLNQIPFKDRAREVLFSRSFFSEEQTDARWDQGAALIVGWVEGDRKRFWLDNGSISAHRYSLFRLPVPLAVPDGEEE